MYTCFANIHQQMSVILLKDMICGSIPTSASSNSATGRDWWPDVPELSLFKSSPKSLPMNFLVVRPA